MAAIKTFLLLLTCVMSVAAEPRGETRKTSDTEGARAITVNLGEALAECEKDAAEAALAGVEAEESSLDCACDKMTEAMAAKCPGKDVLSACTCDLNADGEQDMQCALETADCPDLDLDTATAIADEELTAMVDEISDEGARTRLPMLSNPQTQTWWRDYRDMFYSCDLSYTWPSARANHRDARVMMSQMPGWQLSNEQINSVVLTNGLSHQNLITKIIPHQRSKALRAFLQSCAQFPRPTACRSPSIRTNYRAVIDYVTNTVQTTASSVTCPNGQTISGTGAGYWPNLAVNDLAFEWIATPGNTVGGTVLNAPEEGWCQYGQNLPPIRQSACLQAGGVCCPAETKYDVLGRPVSTTTTTCAATSVLGQGLITTYTNLAALDCKATARTGPLTCCLPAA